MYPYPNNHGHGHNHNHGHVHGHGVPGVPHGYVTGFNGMPMVSPHHFGMAIPQAPQTHRNLTSHDVHLDIRQEPKEALVTLVGKEKARKPVDPPPIIQLRVHPQSDPNMHFLQSPYLFMTCSLICEKSDEPVNCEDKSQALTGSLVSSLHRLKDTNNQDGAFFVFGDVSVKKIGTHRLHFSLFDFHKETREVQFLAAISSQAFRVVKQSDFRGLDESTYLSRAFSDQGVRLRLRKEPRQFGGQKRSITYPETPQQQSGGYDVKHQDDEEDSPPQSKRFRRSDDNLQEASSPLAVRPPAEHMGGYNLPGPAYSNMHNPNSRLSDYPQPRNPAHATSYPVYNTMPMTSSPYPEPSSTFSQPHYNFAPTSVYGPRSDLEGYHMNGGRDAGVPAEGLSNLSVQPAYSLQHPDDQSTHFHEDIHEHEHGHTQQHDNDFDFGRQSANVFADSLNGPHTGLPFQDQDILPGRPKSRYQENVDKAFEEEAKTNLLRMPENGNELTFST